MNDPGSALEHVPSAAANASRAGAAPSALRRRFVRALTAAGVFLPATLGLAARAEGQPCVPRLARRDPDNPDAIPTGSVMWVDVQPDQVWSDLGSSSQFGSERHVVDLTGFTAVKLMANVTTAGSTGSELRVDWEIDPAEAGFATLVGFIDLSTAGVVSTDWVTIPSEARTVVDIAAVAAGGNGKESPETRGVAIMVQV